MSDAKSGPALRVTSKQAGFRRAGRAWPASPVTVPLAEFDDQQVAALRAEPMLVVEDVELPAPEPKPKKTKAK